MVPLSFGSSTREVASFNPLLHLQEMLAEAMILGTQKAREIFLPQLFSEGEMEEEPSKAERGRAQGTVLRNIRRDLENR